MSKQYPGGVISKTPVTPTSLSAPGIWTMNQQAAAQATNTWPFPRDPQFNYVTMLLHGDGAAGPVAATGVGAGVSTTVTNFNADASTNNFNVTINGDARSNNFTPYQADGYWSVGFTGAQTSPSLTYPSISAYDLGATSQFTYECWVYFASVSGEQSIFERFTGTGGPGWLLTKLSTNAYRAHFGSSVYIDTGAIAVAGQWIHLAVSRDGSTGSLFVNGVRQATTGSVANFSDGTDPLVFGERNSGSQTFPFNGYISNARIVKGTYVYNPSSTSITVPTSPLTAITNTVFLGLQSNRYIDNSSNNATATASSASSVQGISPFTQSAANLNTVATYGSGYFDGSGDYLTLPVNSAFDLGTNACCVESWVYLTSTSAIYMFATSSNVNGQTRPNFYARYDQIQLDYYGNVIIQANVSVPQNAWNHVVFTRASSSGAWRIFLNGVLQAYSATGSQNLLQTGAAQLINSLNGSTTASGYIADLRVVNGSVPSAYVTSSTTVGATIFTPPTSPLTAITNTQLLTTQYNGGGNNSGFKDGSSFNWPITRAGNTTQGTFTPYGSNWSNYFNGSSSLSIASSNTVLPTGTQDFSVELFVNWQTQSGSYPQIISNPTTNGFQIYYDVSAGALAVGIFNVANVITYTIAQSTLTGVWTHIAVTRSGNTFRLFVDGVLRSNGTNTISFASPTTQYIASDGSRPYTGYISNVRTVLGSIPTAYQTSSTTNGTSVFTPSTTPLTAVSGTALLTCQSNRYIDNSTNNFTITTNGDTSVQRFSPFAPLTVYNPARNGGSAYFDGSGDGLFVADNPAIEPGSGNFSVECWVYFNDVTSYDSTVISKRVNSASYAAFEFVKEASGNLGVWMSSSGSSWDIVSGGLIVAAKKYQWYHIVLARSGTTFSWYVNGVRSGTTTSSAALFNNAGSFNIGSDTNGVYTYGYISDVRYLVGASAYDATQTTYTVPTAPLTAIANTAILVNTTNAGILDNSGMNDLETVGNAAVSTTVKKYGAASMYFDGSGDYLNQPSSPNLGIGNVFTVECWLYLVSAPTASNAMYVTDFRGGSTNNYAFGVIASSGNTIFYAYLGSTGGEIRGATNITTGTWHHLAFVNTGSTLTGYLNGVSQGTLATSYSQGATNVIIGARYTGATEYINGYIDDLRITKGYARYTANFTVPDQAFPNG